MAIEMIKELETAANGRVMSMNRNGTFVKTRRGLPANHNETITTKPQSRDPHNETAAGQTKIVGWGAIMMMLIAVALISGLLLGWIGTLFNLPPSMTTSGVGASVGITASTLIARRRAATAVQEPDDADRIV